MRFHRYPVSRVSYHQEITAIAAVTAGPTEGAKTAAAEVAVVIMYIY